MPSHAPLVVPAAPVALICKRELVSPELLSELVAELAPQRLAVLDPVNGWTHRDASEFDAIVVDATTFPDAGREALVRTLLRGFEETRPRARVIVWVGSGDFSTARVAAAAGAWEVTFAERDPAELIRRLHTARSLGAIEKPTLPDRPSAEPETRERDETPRSPLLGESAAIKDVQRSIERVAASDIPVLLLGETGTGKELTANAIHTRARGSDRPLVPVNCGAIPDQLLESELFGHAKGAFTGATRARPGRFEAAEGGTLFLDEVSDLPRPLQAKLLRFLEDYTIQRVGDERVRRLDVRIIAASNRDLEEDVRRGAFRRDLYYRLAVFPIHLRPLREREEDVLALGRHFLRRYATDYQLVLVGFTAEAEQAMLAHDWPGNVRELMNRVRRGALVAEGPRVGSVDLGLHNDKDEGLPCSLREARRDAEFDSIRLALLRNRGNKSEAARELGISRTRLYELLQKCGLPHGSGQRGSTGD